jgi:hypothetical protein
MIEAPQVVSGLVVIETAHLFVGAADWRAESLDESKDLHPAC